MKDEGLILLLAFGGAAVLFGGAAVAILTLATLDEDQKRWARALEAAFRAKGLDPRWGVALGLAETRLRPVANMIGTDGERGGAWGPTQITARTARAFGWGGNMADLNTDPDTAAALTADMVAAGFAERGGQELYYGWPETPEQMAAVWNAGRLDTDPALPNGTAGTYIPRLLDYLGGLS